MQILKPSLSAGIGLLLTIPSAYFILINLLNEVGWPGLYNFSTPFLESLGLKEGMGLNINLLIAFGPLLAGLLNLTSVVSLTWEVTQTELRLSFNLLKKWNNWIIIGLGGLCLLTLFLYLMGENCK